MSDLTDALKPYAYSDSGMIGRYTDGPGDNVHLDTAQAVVIAEKLGDPISKPLATMAVIFALNCMEAPGLLKRRPEDLGASSWDEIFGALRSEWSTEHSTVANQVYAYGMAHWFCYDVENPGMLSGRFFFARNPMFVPFVKACLRDPKRAPGILAQTLWSIGLLLSINGDHGDTSGKLLCDVQLDPMRSYWICRKAIEIWTRKMAAQYPGGRREIYSIFFPDHPLGWMQRADFL